MQGRQRRQPAHPILHYSRVRNAGKLDQPAQRGQTRVVYPVINSAPQLLSALIYLQTIPISKGFADHIGFPEKGWGRAGFRPWRVALDNCANHTTDIAWSPQLQFLA